MSCCIQIKMFPLPYIPQMYINDGVFVFDTDDDFDLRLTKNLEELTDIYKIKVDGILGFDLPATPKNNLVLRRYIDPHGTISNKINVQVWVNDSKTLRFTDLYVIGYRNKSYQCEIRTGLEHWIIAAKDLKLNEIDLNNGNKIAYTEAFINQQNALDEYTDGSIGIRFPLVNYGRFVSANTITAQDFRPFVSELWLLQRAFCQIGWKFRSTVLESDFGRRNIAYLLDKDYGFDENKLSLLRANIQRTTAQNGTTNNGDVVEYKNVIENAGGYWNTWNYTGAGIVDIEATLIVRAEKIPVTVNKKSFTLWLKLWMVTPLGITVVIEEYKVDDEWYYWAHNVRWHYLKVTKTDVQIDAGSTIYFTFHWSSEEDQDDYIIELYDRHIFQSNEEVYSYVTINPKKAFLQIGDEYYIEKLLRNDNFFDFLKGVVHKFNGKIYTDYVKNEVWLYPPYDTNVPDILNEDELVKGYFNDIVNQDITNSIQCDSDEIQVIDTGKYRYERLKYKGLGDQAIKDKIGEKKAGDYLAYTVDYGNNYENEKKDNENPYFEATYFGNVDNITVNGIPIAMPWMITEKSDTPKESFDINPRTLYWAGRQLHLHVVNNVGIGIANINIFGQLKTNIPTAWSDPTGTMIFSTLLSNSLAYGERLDKKDLFHMFWQRWLYEIKTSKELRPLIIMSNAGFFKYDFRDTFTFQILGRTVNARMLSLDDHSLCSGISTPAKLYPIRTSYNQCYDIPNSGNGETLFCNGNAPILIITKTGNCYYFSIGGTNVSPVTSVTYEYRLSSTSTWIAASSLCSPNEAFEVRMTVDYSDNCDDITRNRFVDACGNAPEITANYNYDDECFTAEVTGTFVSPIASIVYEYSLDDGLTWLPYTSPNCQSVPNTTTEIRIRATIDYSDGCDTVTVETFLLVPPDQVDCGNITADVMCDGNGIFTRFGDVEAEIAIDIIQYRFDQNEDWKIWDEMTAVSPCPFFYRRVITYCNSICPVYCSPEHECTCTCTETFTITCLNRTLTVNGNITGATITWTGPNGFTASGNNVVFPKTTPSGTFTATITIGSCMYVVNYPYTKPNAGTPILNPTVQ
jgi:hypothetical protein